MPEPETSTTLPEPITKEIEKKEETTSWEQWMAPFGFNKHLPRVLFIAVAAVVLFVATLSSFLVSPTLFKHGARVVVKEGMSLGEVSLLLQGENLIRSRVLFEFCAITLGGDRRILAGEYLFKEPIGGCAMAARIAGGVFGIPAIRVTIPEGLSNKEASVVFAKMLPNFDPAAFISSATSQEGYLFPDTYFFSENTTASDVQARMKWAFDRKIKSLTSDIETSKHSLRDIITMASLLEKEVATDEDRAIVSGILWKRIGKSMPLQVDATFVYLLGKKSSELTQADLQVKSAYNTYRNKGLPAGPINNPGISAIRAAIFPKASPYLYYLADKNGITHYAKTFDEHKANKEKYLR